VIGKLVNLIEAMSNVNTSNTDEPRCSVFWTAYLF